MRLFFSTAPFSYTGLVRSSAARFPAGTLRGMTTPYGRFVFMVFNEWNDILREAGGEACLAPTGLALLHLDGALNQIKKSYAEHVEAYDLQ